VIRVALVARVIRVALVARVIRVALVARVIQATRAMSAAPEAQGVPVR
jgi:hypothetical protein